jgi:hypothetical protein
MIDFFPVFMGVAQLENLIQGLVMCSDKLNNLKNIPNND